MLMDLFPERRRVMMGAAEEASCLGIALLYDSNFAWDQHKVMADGFLLGRCLNNLTWSDERVKVGLARPLFPDAQSVLPDEAKAAALAYSHLKAQGLNHFACYRNLDPMLLEYQYLEDAFLEIADSELCFRNGLHVKEKWSLMRHFLDLKDWLESLPKPIGILCSDEEHALRLMRVVNDSPYSIPDDIALMAYGVDLTQGSGLGISGVDPISEEVGARGIRELHRLMNGGKPTEEPVMIPPRGVRVSLTTDRRFSLYPLVRTVIQRFEQSGFARKSKDGKRSLERNVYTAPDGSLGAPMVILIQDRFQGYTPNVQKQMNLTLQPNIKNSEWHPAKKSMEILESFEGVKRSFMIQALSSTELKGRFINYDGINPRGALRLTLDPKTESRPAIDVTSPDMLMDGASRDQMEGFLSDLETAEKELDDADSVLLWMISIQETGQPHPVLEGSTAQPTLNGKALPAGFMNK